MVPALEADLLTASRTHSKTGRSETGRCAFGGQTAALLVHQNDVHACHGSANDGKVQEHWGCFLQDLLSTRIKDACTAIRYSREYIGSVQQGPEMGWKGGHQVAKRRKRIQRMHFRRQKYARKEYARKEYVQEYAFSYRIRKKIDIRAAQSLYERSRAPKWSNNVQKL